MKKRISILGTFIISALLVGCSNNVQTKTSESSSSKTNSRIIKSDESTATQTIYGKIQGYLDGDIFTFKGIPYAKAERFMPPQYPDKFDGIKICRLYGPKAPQSTTTLKWAGDKESDYAFGNQFNLEPMDEGNCLVLNVWTKGLNDGKKRPVFFWMHGGGFSSGSGIDLPCYEGRALAEKGDIVVVSVNHRLNILGYLDLSALGGKYSESVNLGQQDLVKALEWVKSNIANFGGDPDNVTIGGQSGGGGKVGTTMMMPSAKGLFNKAIVQSGSMTSVTHSEFSRQLGLAFIKELGLSNTQLDKINEFSYEELVDAGNKAIRALNDDPKMKESKTRVGYSPTLDGKYIVAPSFDPNAPEVSRDVPMIIGTNLNEFCFNNSIEISKEEAKKKLTERLKDEEQANKFIECFEQVYPNQAPKELLNTDISARTNAVKQAISKSKQGGANVYLYLFTWKPSVNALGASHGMELPFMFNNIDLQREMTGGTDDAYQLADLMSSAWIAFIKTGDPNTEGLPQWTPFTEENGVTMIFDNQPHAEQNHDKALLNFKMPGFF